MKGRKQRQVVTALGARATMTRKHAAWEVRRSAVVPPSDARCASFQPWGEPMVDELDAIVTELAGLCRLDAEIARLELLQSAPAAEAQ